MTFALLLLSSVKLMKSQDAMSEHALALTINKFFHFYIYRGQSLYH